MKKTITVEGGDEFDVVNVLLSEFECRYDLNNYSIILYSKVNHDRTRTNLL